MGVATIELTKCCRPVRQKDPDDVKEDGVSTAEEQTPSPGADIAEAPDRAIAKKF